jgi:hypothetical protein
MSLIETAIDKAKDLAKLAQKLDNIEIIQRVLDVQGELLRVQEELQALRTENEELKSAERIDQDLVLRDNAYWHESAPESRKGPFCARCWPVDRKLVPVVVRSDGFKTCPNCEATFQRNGYTEPGPAMCVVRRRGSDRDVLM